jgi:hypothetical protein
MHRDGGSLPSGKNLIDLCPPVVCTTTNSRVLVGRTIQFVRKYNKRAAGPIDRQGKQNQGSAEFPQKMRR